MKKARTPFVVAGCVCLIACLVVSFSTEARAEVDYLAKKILRDIQLGKNNKNQIIDLRVKDDVIVGGDLAMDGNLSGISNVVLANAETIDNATDSEVRVTYDDDAAVLGTLKLESDNAALSMADNDAFRIDAVAQPSNSAAKVTFGRDVFVFSDVTSNSVDGAKEVWISIAGTLTRALLLNPSGLTVQHVVATNGTFAGTVAAGLYQFGGANGFSGIQTNKSTLGTNLTYWNDGGVTQLVVDGSVQAP